MSHNRDPSPVYWLQQDAELTIEKRRCRLATEILNSGRLADVSEKGME